MNFAKLVEDGKYKKADLNELNKAFIDGMEHVLNNVLEQDIEWALDFTATSETLAKIEREIADKTIEAVKTNVYLSICESIVAMIDEQAVEQDDLC